MFTRHVEMVEEAEDPEVCARSATVAVQLALAYVRVIETGKIEHDMAAYEHLLGRGHGNGHGR